MRELFWVCVNILFEFFCVVKECFVCEIVFDGGVIIVFVFRNIDFFYYYVLIFIDIFLWYISDKYMY